jgi:signal transduction histidine kinase
LSTLLPLKESSRDLIVEVANTLEPYFPDISACWREKLTAELGLDGRTLAALERLNISTGSSYFHHGNLAGFFENLGYFGNRLAKLQIDTRAVARSLELYQTLCEPYLSSLFGERLAEAKAALEMLSAATFQTVSGAYFDTKTGESAALLAVLDAELSAPNLSALLQRVLEITIATFGAANGVVLLRDPDSDLLHVSTSVGLDEASEDLTIAVGQGFSGRVAQSGEPDLVLDAGRDERIQKDALRRSASSIWAVPMKTAEATTGVLMIGFSKPYEWLPTERELMRAIGDRTALAIERARMTDALRQREQKIAELSAHLLRVQEEERKRISRELHDETGQALMVIRLYLGMMEANTTARGSRARIRETVAVVDRTIEGIRRIIGKLSPLVLQELGLVAAIRKEAKHLTKTTGVKARVLIAEDVGRLAPGAEQAIYRVVQEALHNVAKHAQAHNVLVQVTRERELVHVVVEDDGIGIHGRGNPRNHSFGLAGIKERMAMLGGTSRVVSAKGKGTRIEISVPAGEPVPQLEHTPARAAAQAAARPN